ncbi:MAG: hypothetical protein CM15mP58_08390 [Burkholderiaceae bacterium]|nr:MAG: hypothetical protein CM15mP58_08390 [Burkholderiaceae bacterium]
MCVGRFHGLFSSYLIICIKDIGINGEKLSSICVGEILYSHGHFSEVLRERSSRNLRINYQRSR